MQSLLNREFLDLAGDRNYPLEEGATGLSDSGDKLPDNIVTDAQLVLAPDLGNAVFILSVSVSSTFVPTYRTYREQSRVYYNSCLK